MENQRIRISKRMIKDALLELLETQSISMISVTELCFHAQINRTTFYKYYGNPQDVLSEIEADILSELELRLNTYEGTSNHLRLILEFLQEHRRTILVLLPGISNHEVTNHLFHLPAIQQLLFPLLPSEYSDSEKELLYLYICQGCYAVLWNWLSDDCRISPKEMAAFLHTLAQKTLITNVH